MNNSYVSFLEIPRFSPWEKIKKKRALISFDMEITARCNNNCRHCYINLSAEDEKAKKEELSLKEISNIAEEAVSLGALWCLITGGEPLLREDFFDVFLELKSKGLLVSIFTNATLITKEHINFFKKYPPRDIEVSVYGVTKKTYEKVTRKEDSFHAFIQGLNLLLDNGIKVRLKAMALSSNLHEFHKISHFCREKTTDYFRFDPFLHLRFDGNKKKNLIIKRERLDVLDIIELEQSDPERFNDLKKRCDYLIVPDYSNKTCAHLFYCRAGLRSFTLGPNGLFKLCSSLCHPDCMYDLRKGNLSDAWMNFANKVVQMESYRKEYLENCHVCPIINLCMWCPASAFLETGEMDKHVDFFCRIAHARANALK